MINGFWTAQFVVPGRGTFGQGVAVIRDGQVFGGDGANTYTGSYSVSGETATFNLQITPYGQPQGPNVFGDLEGRSLELTGRLNEKGFTLHGDEPQPIEVRMEKRSDI